MGFCSRVFLIAIMLLALVVHPAFGQSSNAQTPPAGATGMTGSAARDPSVAPPVNPPAGNTNALGVNPITGLGTASAANYHPLTGKERWHLYWKQNYASPGAYFGPVFTALVLDQSTNTPRAWGGGWPGFGRRLGSRTAMAMTQGTIQASLAAVLDEDVRYISSADTGFKRRLLHAIKFSFLTYNSKGQTRLNIANLTSIYATTAISTAWVPIQGSGAKYTLTNGSAQIALTVPINIVQEFWPEIRHTVLRRP
jgi:hypothetical protein